MSSNLRVVLDTNVVVSAALFPQSRPGEAVDYAMSHSTIIASTATLAELSGVLLRPYFERYLQESRRLEFLHNLEQDSELVTITHSIAVCRDPKDDKFLELAVSGNATHIITGDNDLLDLHPFRNIPILNPAVFMERQAGQA